jgi:DNA-binding transcriptional LysR family regulator
MRFHKLDLNLLVAFDAMLKERSVSRAAEQLNLSQSAMSSALARLRDFFQDDLFVPVGKRMIPTPLAVTLEDQVRHILLQTQVLIGTRPAFDPARAERLVRMIASDFVIDVLLIDVIKRLRVEAPGLHLDIEVPSRSGVTQLSHADIELMITPQFVRDPDQPWEPLFEDRYVCCAWSGNTGIGPRMSKDDYLAASHVQVCFGRDRTKTFDSLYMERMGLHRNETLTVPSFNSLPHVIWGTDLITTLPSKLADKYKERAPLAIYPLPIEIEPLVMVMQWNRSYDRDPLLMWLRRLIQDQAHHA